MSAGEVRTMGKHHLDNRTWRRWNRVVRRNGRLHFFRVNVPDGVFNAWFVND
jgi:hypothetical protein